MSRTVFTVDAFLDAAREVVLTHGLRAATITEIARQAGAPVGSIYHRFSSVDELLMRAWLRAAEATQRVHREVDMSGDDPLDIAARLAVAFYDHCVARPEDVLLLDRISHQDLAGLDLTGDQRAQITRSDAQAATLIAGMARAVFGHDSHAASDAVVLALVDLPQSFTRRYLQSRREPPRQRRDQLPAAVRAVLRTRESTIPAGKTEQKAESH